MFRLEEAAIAEPYQAIRDGAVTCVAVVKHYIDRVRAYKGVSSMLVTEDGEPMRAGAAKLNATFGRDSDLAAMP